MLTKEICEEVLEALKPIDDVMDSIIMTLRVPYRKAMKKNPQKYENAFS